MQQRILIAEDDEVQAAVLVAAMRHRGYTADTVGDGLEAIRSLRTGKYDLAILDYNMPQIDGRAVAQLLQELPGNVNRPRLIAVTAAAELLNDCENANGSSSFDAVLSKNAGIPALFELIQQNLRIAAALNNASLQAREREHCFQARALQKQRRRAPLFALPGIAMAACFATALWWTVASVDGIAGSIHSARLTVVLNTDAQALVGVVADTEASQRSYLVTGSAADRDAFEANQQRVDRLLVSATSLNPSGAPGFGEGASPTAVIESLLHALSEEADLRGTVPAQQANTLTSSQSSRTAAERIRAWANSLVADSQNIVVGGLDLVRQNLRYVTIFLAFGVVYGLWNAWAATWRQLKATDPRVRLADPRVSMEVPPAVVDVELLPHRFH